MAREVERRGPAGLARKMVPFHRTTAACAAAILREGFRDGRGRYLTDQEWSGVWLSAIT